MSAFTLFRIVGLAALLSLTVAGANSFAAPPLGQAGGLLGALPTIDGRDRDAAPRQTEREEPLRFAQANCSSAAAQAAAETGGEVLSVSSSEKDGQVVCVVTVLVPGKDGGRPRRTTVTLPG